MEKKLDLEKFKTLLMKERELLEHEHHALAQEGAEGGSELSDYDNHPADAASDTYERTKGFALEENFKEMIDRIDEALRKIHEGTYGQCDRCGTSINPDRLKAIPYATLCIDCQETLDAQ